MGWHLAPVSLAEKPVKSKINKIEDKNSSLIILSIASGHFE